MKKVLPLFSRRWRPSHSCCGRFRWPIPFTYHRRVPPTHLIPHGFYLPRRVLPHRMLVFLAHYQSNGTIGVEFSDSRTGGPPDAPSWNALPPLLPQAGTISPICSTSNVVRATRSAPTSPRRPGLDNSGVTNWLSPWPKTRHWVPHSPVPTLQIHTLPHHDEILEATATADSWQWAGPACSPPLGNFRAMLSHHRALAYRIHRDSGRAGRGAPPVWLHSHQSAGAPA